LNELQSLGQQLATAVKSLWESEDSRRLRQEIGDGFSELGRQMDSAVKSAQDSEAAQQFRGQVKETVEKAKESDVVDKIEDGLATGLRELNVQISKLVSSLEDKPSVEDEPEAEPGA
jgi:hypothetical protein